VDVGIDDREAGAHGVDVLRVSGAGAEDVHDDEGREQERHEAPHGTRAYHSESRLAWARTLIYAGHVLKTLVTLVVGIAWLTTGSSASAQMIAPLRVGGPAQAALQQLHPPAPVDQVREQAMRRAPPLPLPEPPAERLVPERRVYAPDLGRILVIPSHYERRISDQQYAVPALPAYESNGGPAGIIPGGNRPPADVRQGP
jgi:hypothetical protein